MSVLWRLVDVDDRGNAVIVHPKISGDGECVTTLCMDEPMSGAYGCGCPGQMFSAIEVHTAYLVVMLRKQMFSTLVKAARSDSSP